VPVLTDAGAETRARDATNPTRSRRWQQDRRPSRGCEIGLQFRQKTVEYCLPKIFQAADERAEPMHARRFFAVMAAFWIAGVLTVNAGEDRPKPFHFYFLQYPIVQQELRFSPTQTAEATALVRTYDAALWTEILHGSPPDLKNLSREPRIRKIQENSEVNARRTRKVTAQFTPQFEKLLNPHQRQRLLQIDWQHGWKLTGGRVLNDPELLQAIGLSEKQRAELTAIYDQFRDKEDHLIYSESAQANSPGLPKLLAEMERLYPEWGQAMAQVLTQEQTHKLDAVMGKPIDLSRLSKEMKEEQDRFQREGPFRKP
jgi:hypothetical protein